MQLINLVRITVLHFLQLSIKIVPHQLQVLVILFSYFDQSELLLIC